MKEIQLTRGKVALVDDEDFEYLNQWKWHALKGRCTWYAVRSFPKGNCIYMHRILFPGAVQVDHRAGSGLNNQRSSNLRPATGTQNQGNRGLDRDNRSGVKGVYWHKKSGKWMARVGRVYVGIFENLTDAARAYNAAAQEHFGEFARLNPII